MLMVEITHVENDGLSGLTNPGQVANRQQAAKVECVVGVLELHAGMELAMLVSL